MKANFAGDNPGIPARSSPVKPGQTQSNQKNELVKPSKTKFDYQRRVPICCGQVTIAEKQRQLTAILTALKTAPDRLNYIVGRGRAAPRLDAAFKTDAFRV